MKEALTFTPVPLFIHDESFINKDGKRVGAIRITDTPESCGKWIGETQPYGSETGNFPEHDEAMAYAQLFVAAPDMLSALQAAIDIADKELIENFSGHRSAECQAVYDQVRAAIAKATGN